MKPLLFALLFVGVVSAQTITGTTGWIKVDTTSRLYVTIKTDTVFSHVDSSKVLIGIDNFNGTITPTAIWRVDSVWRINSNYAWSINRIVKTHYYTLSGTRIRADQDVYFLIKTWWKAE